MKYAIIIPDGAADDPLPELNGKTPLEAARTPNMDRIATEGRVGLVRTIPDGFESGSDVATMCLLGYDPKVFHTGRAPLEAAAQHIPLPPPPAPGAPGPFAFGDRDRVRAILTQAGFGDAAFEDVRVTLGVGGGGLEDAVRFLLEGVGPTTQALREADPALRPRVYAAVREALAPYETPAGIRMPAAAWIVTTRA